MSKNISTEDILKKLNEISRGPLSSSDVEYLVNVLSSKNNIVSSRAAQIIGRSGISDFIPPLSTTFKYFLNRPDKDKGCFAKEAICRALDSLKCLESSIYLNGIHHIQMEPVYGGREDTAANLRGLCALALSRIMYEDIHFELVSLLMDTEVAARRTAVDVLTSLACERSELMLRMKILAGDKEPDVIGKCFTGLIVMAPKKSIPFVANFLTSDNSSIAGMAALALGESEDEDALNSLKECWNNNTDLYFEKSLIMAMALSRREAAFRLLIDIVVSGSRKSALVAVEALEIYASESRRKDEIQAAVNARNDRGISEAFNSYKETI